MLSRSTSTAGDRLRRAKSNTSTTTASSGHLRSSTSIDPFVSQQHAEAAALEAFKRARQNMEQVAQPRVTRRKSQVTGRTEGSHLADARLNRRKSASTHGGHGNFNENQGHREPDSSQYQGQVSSLNHEQERIITRKRSVIPPSAYAQCQNGHLSLPPPTSRNLRRIQSAYSEGSPTPRHSSQLYEQSSILQVRTPVRSSYQSKPANFSDFDSESAHAINVPSSRSVKPLVRKTQTDEDILAIARDKCLQNVHQSKVRQKTSLMLAPFQRRHANQTAEIANDGDENVVSPYKNAVDVLAGPNALPSASLLKYAPSVRKDSQTKRHFSETFKGRIMKVFRKSSTVTNMFSAQQVEANHRHYPNSDPDCFAASNCATADPFIVITPGSPIKFQGLQGDGAESRLSNGRASTMKSRVTSWTNSTIAATLSSRADDERLPAVDENGAIKHDSSNQTLRKRSSFFGQPVLNKLRRASKTDIGGSEESHGLFAALQERIRPKTTNTPDLSNENQSSMQLRIPSALANLNSHSRPNSSASSVKRRSEATIRSVSPTVREGYSRVPSPIVEVLSPLTESRTCIDSQSASTRHRKQAKSIQAEAPSRELIAQRMERSKNRWQSSLDELSSQISYSTKPTVAGDTPSELPLPCNSIERTYLNENLANPTKLTQSPQAVARELLSPSVYSRGTNDVSPRPDSPSDEERGTVITITGHEVRRYSISPQRKDSADKQPVQGSREWRRWLSGEINGFKTEAEDYCLTTSILHISDHSDMMHNLNMTNADLKTWRTSSISLPTELALSKDRTSLAGDDTLPPTQTIASTSRPIRPRASSSQRSSFMNDRYPMLDTGHNSSNNSVKSGRLSSSRAGNRDSSAESQPPSSKRPTALQNSTPANITDAIRIGTAQKSTAMVKSTTNDLAPKDRPYNRRRSTMVAKSTMNKDESTHAEVIVQPLGAPPKASSRPKSAFNLRANFKTNSYDSAKPLEVRRKPVNDNIMEDDTIIAISAGPYAGQFSFTSGNKENATPPADVNSLPALSSSEWLAAGPNKGRKSSATHPALRDQSSRYLSVKAPMTSSPKESKGSPAHRMVNDFLEKRSRENTPAFV